MRIIVNWVVGNYNRAANFALFMRLLRVILFVSVAIYNVLGGVDIDHCMVTPMWDQ